MESEREKLIALLKIRDANGELLYGEQGELNYESIVDVVMPFILAREAEKDRRIEEAIGILISGTNKSDSVGDLMYDRLAIQEACKVLKGEK